MLRLNLLPTQKRMARARWRREALALGLVILGVVAGFSATYQAQAGQRAALRETTARMQSEVDALDAQAAMLRAAGRDLENLQKRVKTLKRRRHRQRDPARLLLELADVLGKHRKVWLRKLHGETQHLRLEGSAFDAKQIAAFQRALTRKKRRFRDVHLAAVQRSGKNGERLDWVITCKTTVFEGR